MPSHDIRCYDVAVSNEMEDDEMANLRGKDKFYGEDTGDLLGYYDSTLNLVVDMQGRERHMILCVEDAETVMLEWGWKIELR